ncbi:MAG: hypothetical protein K6F51_02885 [Acetatifactor sp.]|nr:hypothetical protein [Acetatifactor sp.]
MKKKRKMLASLGVVLVMGMVFAGCGKDDSWKKWTQEQMAIDKDGQITYCVTDNFDKNYYDLEELTGMAVQEAAQYNGEHKRGESTPVTIAEIAKINENGNEVRVVYQFDGYESYTGFVGTKLYYGTLEEAIRQKLIFTGSELYGASGTITLDEATKEKMKTRHVLVTDAKTLISLPYDAQYYSHDVKMLENGTADTTGCEDVAVILLKK